MNGPKRSDDRRRGARGDPARPGAPSESAGRLDGRPEAATSSERDAAEAPAREAEPEGADAQAEAATGGQAEVQEVTEEDAQARLEAERDEYLALAQRTKADFDNYRKRATRDIAAAGIRGKVELARELLPVVDNLERALESAGEDEAGLAEGVRLVHSELVAALERNGVETIQAGGERFDPKLHEALTTRAEDGAESGVVLDVVQKGYRLNSTVLRPARVVVAS